jgi:hypothetical protein
MSRQTIRLLHRISVDWVADTFGRRTPGPRTRNEDARYRARARAGARHGRARDRARANARALPARLHAERGEPRVLTAWQARIGRRARPGGGQS